MTLHDYLIDRFELKRTICPGTASGYLATIRSIGRFMGRPVLVGDLSPDLLNAWLRSLVGLAPDTLAFYRRHALSLWRAAGEDELCPTPQTWRLRRIAAPRRIPVAWTVDEVRRLLHAAKGLDGDYPRIGVRRDYFWQVAGRVGWDTALRRYDLLGMPRELFAEGVRRAVIVQSKTGKPVLVGIHESTASFLAAVPHWPKLVWWPYSDEYFRAEWHQIVKMAGLSGPWKKLRKSSGTDVERNHPGYGPAHLGHSLGPRVSSAHYFDPRFLALSKPMPTEL